MTSFLDFVSSLVFVFFILKRLQRPVKIEICYKCAWDTLLKIKIYGVARYLKRTFNLAE